MFRTFEFKCLEGLSLISNQIIKDFSNKKLGDIS